MGLNFWLSQGFGFFALILVCLSYHFNDKRKFLAFQILANLFYACAFLVVGVLVGGVNTLISLLRVTVLYFFERKDKSPPKLLYITFFLLYIASGVLCYQTPLDILAIISFQIFNLAMFIRNIAITRYMMVAPNFMTLAYNLLSGTFTNAMLDIAEITVLIIAIFRFSKNREIKRGRYLY